MKTSLTQFLVFFFKIGIDIFIISRNVNKYRYKTQNDKKINIYLKCQDLFFYTKYDKNDNEIQL